MSVSDVNKQKVRQFIEEVLNEGRLELIDELVAKDFIGRLGCAAFALNGPDGVRRFVSCRRLLAGKHVDAHTQCTGPRVSG
jgi:hypothetical protein